MRTRVFTMIGLWALILAVFGFGGMLGGQILLLLIALGVMWELSHLLNRVNINPAWKIELSPLVMMTALALGLAGNMWGFSSIGLSLSLILILLTQGQRSPASLVAALGSLLLVGVGLGSLNALAQLPAHGHALEWVVWVIATIKLSDAGAFIFGRTFGRHALAPQISPHKTIEGFAGAILGGIIMGIMGLPLFYDPWLSIILGPILALLGSIGDLAESQLKRIAGVKDSGNILPGIGGLLDLCDSLMLACPVAYLFIRFGNFF